MQEIIKAIADFLANHIVAMLSGALLFGIPGYIFSRRHINRINKELKGIREDMPKSSSEDDDNQDYKLLFWLLVWAPIILLIFAGIYELIKLAIIQGVFTT